MYEICPWYVMDVQKMSLVRYGCTKAFFSTLLMYKRCPLYVMDVQKISLVRYR